MIRSPSRQGQQKRLLALLCVVLSACCALCTIITVYRTLVAGRTPIPEGRDAPSTATLVASAQVAPADPHDLAQRLGRSAAGVPGATTTADTMTVSPHTYAPGDHELFWVMNLDEIATFQVMASLRYVRPHLHMWVQDGLDLSQEALEASAWVFEEHVYPTVRRHFGSEWSPGIDDQPQLSVLNARFSGALGYFSSVDEFPVHIRPHSNQREMFYINPEHAPPASVTYDTTLAHELQHMIHWHADKNEDSWVNEGASELAVHLCGFSREARINGFARLPDTQLTTWEKTNLAEHYGASFLFLTYFSERYGPEMTRELVANQANGIAGFDAVLRDNRTGLNFQDLFADWLLANYLDREEADADSDYDYSSLDVQVSIERSISDYPAVVDSTVHQYAADYVQLLPSGQNLRLEFSGAATARLVPNEPHSGSHYWWSNRGDSSNMSLTRAFDLSGLQQATLEVWLWYDIEEGWDHAYVEASADGGTTWQILSGEHSTTANPSGNSYGPAYTGLSQPNPQGDPTWVQERFDLSPFAGGRVLIRFEYITDEGVHHAGLCVDDIAIPELEYTHGAEGGPDEWMADGFVLSDNIVPQQYILQIIRVSAPEPQSGTRVTTVERLPLECSQAGIDLEERQAGTWMIEGQGTDMEKMVLVIAATAPSTTELAPYHYEIDLLD